MTGDEKRPSVRIEEAANKVEAAASSNWRLLRWLLPVLFVIGVAIVALFLILRNVDNSVDSLDDKVTHVGAQVDQVDAQVNELGEFVDELQQPPGDDEVARNEAISAAVRLVPEIKDILCEQFPQATACNVP